ncbi:MAG TPA: GumC family protein [bacterium]|nr:GumC family protein [bacterium]HOH06990.1 GumC family protein [bacterium]HOY43236.1 GumC family protein [bacterium]HPG82852.1 GumC family protein [bacterium]HPM60095.1 GumC family protein [bacterium]
MIQYSKYDSPMSPQSFMGVLQKRGRVVLFLFLAIVGVITIAAFLVPPTYRANARLMINYQLDIEKEHLLSLIQIHDKSYYERLSSEPIIMRMRSILEPVVAALGLDRRKGSAAEPTPSDRDRAIELLGTDLEVEREKDSNVLRVSYESRNPALAASIVSQVVEQYIKQRPALERDERESEYFDKQIQQVSAQIDELEKKGMEYKARERVLSVDHQSSILFETLADYDKRLTEVRTERLSKEARLKVIREQLTGGGEIVIPNTESGNAGGRYLYVNELSKSLLGLEIRKSSLEQKYTSNHPELASVLAQIDENKKKIDQAVKELIQGEEIDIKAKQAEERALAGSMAQVAYNVTDLSRKEYDLGRLTIGIDDLKSVYSMLLRQREQARLAANRQEYLVQVKVLEAAAVPQRPVSPNRPLWIALGLLLGLVVALGVAFFMEYFDHSVNSADDVHNCLGLPILATIGDFKTPMGKQNPSRPGDEAGAEE